VVDKAATGRTLCCRVKRGPPAKEYRGADAEHFWQKRYYDFNIRNYPQFVEKLRYIHRNPVKQGLRASGGLAAEQPSPLRYRR